MKSLTSLEQEFATRLNQTTDLFVASYYTAKEAGKPWVEMIFRIVEHSAKSRGLNVHRFENALTITAPKGDGLELNHHLGGINIGSQRFTYINEASLFELVAQLMATITVNNQEKK